VDNLAWLSSGGFTVVGMDRDSGFEPDDAGDVVLAALASIRASIGALAGATLWSRPDARARDGVREGFAVLQSMHAVWLGLVADLDTRPGAVPRARAGLVAQTFLRSSLRRTAEQASADVRAAHALSPAADPIQGGLPELGRAFAAGQISREHVDVAIRTLRHLPKDVLSEPVPAEPIPADPSATGAKASNEPERTGTDVPGDAATKEAMVSAGEAVDVFFAQWAKQLDSRQTKRVASNLLAALDPDGRDGFDPGAHERRGLTHSTDGAGMVVGKFQLDPAGGATFTAALEHFSAPEPTRREENQGGTSTVVRDTRSAGQRRADALTQICRLALSSALAGTGKSGEPPRIVVHAGVAEVREALRRVPHCHSNSDSDPDPDPDSDPDLRSGHHPALAPKPATSCQSIASEQRRTGTSQSSGWPITRGATCEPLGPIGAQLLGRFACDALLQRVLLAPNGAVLNLGRDTRTISPAQRRALNARDRGCVIPGCTAPPAWCDGHHVNWWRHGGRTDIDDLALVCGRDHTLIHLGVWDLTMIDGIPWARPPEWIDPWRRLIRNTYQQDADHARSLGTQLRLALDPPDPQPPSTDAPPPPVDRPPERSHPSPSSDSPGGKALPESRNLTQVGDDESRGSPRQPGHSPEQAPGDGPKPDDSPQSGN